MISWKVIVPLIGITIYCLYSTLKKHDDSDTEDMGQSILTAWSSVINEATNKFERISIGINANVDLIVHGTEVMKSLGLQPGQATDHLVINTPEQLEEAFSYYFARGAAVERPYSNPASYRDIVQKAGSLQNASWYIGGNAALMAQNIVTRFDDVHVQLVGPVGPRLQKLLDRAINVPVTALTEEDEVHLILEYSSGESWGSARAPVATRFITSYDEANGRVASLENFFSSVGQLKPDLVVCAGIHMLESQPSAMRSQRINVLVQGLQDLPPNLPVHMELASMVDSTFVSQLLTETLFHVTSLGLNEQELAFMSQSLGGPHHDILSHGQPEIYKVTDIITWILETFGKSSKNPLSKLTRVHFHSLTFHIMAGIHGHWENMEAAVAAGASVAGRKACDVLVAASGQFDLKIPHRFKLSSKHEEMDFDPTRPVISWSMGENSMFVFSPVLVCRRPLKTVGLGDAISAVGLLYSQFVKS